MEPRRELPPEVGEALLLSRIRVEGRVLLVQKVMRTQKV